MQNELEGLQYQLKKAEEELAFHKKVEALTNQPLFRDVILNGYCRDEAARFITASVNPGLSMADREEAVRSAQACGELKLWLQASHSLSRDLESRIVEIKEELDNLRAEASEE